MANQQQKPLTNYVLMKPLMAGWLLCLFLVTVIFPTQMPNDAALFISDSVFSLILVY